MIDKVQKIKEFLIGMAGAACCDAKTKKNIEKNILPFINSLQEEPVCNINFEQELYKYFGQVKDFTLGMRIAKRFYEMGKHSNVESNVKDWEEEPVSEDLGDYVNKLSKQFPEVSFAKLSRIAVRVANWQKRQEYTCYEEAFEDGAKWKVENLWKPADGDDLPPIDKEVVVFTQNFPNDAGIMTVAIAHRPDPKGWNGKSITTGKVEHYTPKTYGKGGWNIPDIKFWLDVELPKEIEL